jgi:hypothetical protein
MESDWFCTGVLKVRHPYLMRAMNYSAPWRSIKAVVSIRCLTFNTRANRVAIVCFVIARIFNPMQALGGHISTLSNKDSRDLFCVVNSAHCQLLSCIIVQFIVNLLFDFHSVFCLMKLFSSTRFYCPVSCHPVNIQS